MNLRQDSICSKCCMSFDLFLKSVRKRNEHHIRRRPKVWTGTKAQSGFAGAQNKITYKMMKHCGIPVSRRRRAKNPDHLLASGAHRLLSDRGFDRRVVDRVIICAEKCSVLCDILSHRTRCGLPRHCMCGQCQNHPRPGEHDSFCKGTIASYRFDGNVVSGTAPRKTPGVG